MTLLSKLSPASLLRPARRLSSGALLGLFVVTAAACGSAGSTADTSAATRAAHGAPVASPVAALLEALDELGLTDAQRAFVAQKRAEAKTLSAPVRAARKALADELAAEVRLGKLDRARLEPLVDTIAAELGKLKPAVQGGFAALHDKLDPAQRRALVEAMKEHMDTGLRRGAMRERLAELADDLGLTDAQRATIRGRAQAMMAQRMGEARGERARMRSRFQALGAAFEADTVDPGALDVGAEMMPGARRAAGALIAFLELALPELTPAQRALLADKLQAHGARADG